MVSPYHVTDLIMLQRVHHDPVSSHLGTEAQIIQSACSQTCIMTAAKNVYNQHKANMDTVYVI
jgi:hypothetical protein